jgi:hypothetical protein
MYREWSDLARELTELSKVREQLQAAAAEVDNVIFVGDINLDTARRSDVRYGLHIPHARAQQRCGRLQHEVPGDRGSRTAPTDST